MPEEIKVQQTPTQTVVTPKPNPGPIVPKPSLAAQVNAAQGTVVPRPKTLRSGTTQNVLNDSYFRAVLYSETSARKTVTAARFAGGIQTGTPQEILKKQLAASVPHTRFILSRPDDQLIPLDGYDFKFEYCPDRESLNYALRYPEQLWPDFFTGPDPEKLRTIVVDDITQAISVILNDSAARDLRKAYLEGLKDFEAMLYPLTRKNCNLILVSLANVKENKYSGEEQIGPLMSDSFRAYVLASFAAVLYVQTKNWKLLTERDRFTVMGIDEKTGKEVPYTREIFSKVKSPVMLSDDPQFKIPKEVDLDLAALWSRIRGGKK